MSQPYEDPEYEDQEGGGLRLAVLTPIVLTAAVVGGLVWWVQSDGDETIERLRAQVVEEGGEVPAGAVEVAIAVDQTATAPAADAVAGTEVAAETAMEVAAVEPVTDMPAETLPTEMTGEAAAADAGAAFDGRPVEEATVSPPPAPAGTMPVDVTPVGTAQAVAPSIAALSIEPVPSVHRLQPAQPSTAIDAPGLATSTIAPAPVLTAAEPPAAAPAGRPIVETANIAPATVTPAEAPVDAARPGGVAPLGTAAVQMAMIATAPVEVAPVELATVTPTAMDAADRAPDRVVRAEGRDTLTVITADRPVSATVSRPDVSLGTIVADLVARSDLLTPPDDGGVIQAETVDPATLGIVGLPETLAAEQAAGNVADGPDAAAEAEDTATEPPGAGTVEDAAADGAEDAAESTADGAAELIPGGDPAALDPMPVTSGGDDRRVIVAETIDPAALGIITAEEVDFAALAGGMAPEEQADALAEDAAAEDTTAEDTTAGPAAIETAAVEPAPAEPAQVGIAAPEPAEPEPVLIEPIVAEPVVVEPEPPVVTPPVLAEVEAPAIVVETVDFSSFEDWQAVAGDSGTDDQLASAEIPAEVTDAVPGEDMAVLSGLPMVAALSVIEPPRPAWQRYAAAPVVAVGDGPSVSVIVTGLGQSRSRTATALESLPSAVALAFDPYAEEVAGMVEAARREGHEVLMMVPMEAGTETVDAGPLALSTALAPEENADRLDWVLGRAHGFVGVLTPPDSTFSADPEAMTPIIEALRGQGLMVVAGAPGGIGGALPVDLPIARAGAVIGLPPGPDAFPAMFEAVERRAREDGRAVILVQPYPATLRSLAAWLDTLPDKGLTLTPVTATVSDAQAAALP